MKQVIQKDFQGHTLYKLQSGKYELNGKVFDTTTEAFNSVKEQSNEVKPLKAKEVPETVSGDTGADTPRKAAKKSKGKIKS